MANEDRNQKIVTLLKTLMSTSDGLSLIRDTLRSGGISTLQQVEAMTFPEVTDPVRLANAEEGVLMDTETTGVDTSKDKVIQLAMRKVKYDSQGILSVGEVFDRFRDPGMPIPAEVTRITRITDEDVKGHTIDDGEVRAFLGDAKKVICHNAGFDRKMVERNFPDAGFDKIDFDCTFAQVDWLSRGCNGRSLEQIALQAGYVYGSHNALNDINVMPYILNQDHPELGTPWSELYANSNASSILLIAENSTFAVKDHLKENGYRWSPDGQDAAGYEKSWYKILPDDPEVLAEEADFLREKIYQRDASLPAFRISGMERYSARRPVTKEVFRTAEVRTAIDVVAQKSVTQEPQGAFGF